MENVDDVRRALNQGRSPWRLAVRRGEQIYTLVVGR
jgi:hypothetical protein